MCIHVYMSAKHIYGHNMRMVGYINAPIKHFLGFDLSDKIIETRKDK